MRPLLFIYGINTYFAVCGAKKKPPVLTGGLEKR